MDKMIVIPLNIFKLDQEVIIVDESGNNTFAQVDLAHLPEVITEASRVYGINNVKLIGNISYAEALSNEIDKYTLQNYSENKLNISIMEV